MKKGQIVEGIIERVDFPNKGILRAEDGTRVIVKNAIMGQENVRDACSRCWKNLHWNCRNRDVFIMVSAAAVHSRAFRMKNSFP